MLQCIAPPACLTPLAHLPIHTKTPPTQRSGIGGALRNEQLLSDSLGRLVEVAVQRGLGLGLSLFEGDFSQLDTHVVKSDRGHQQGIHTQAGEHNSQIRIRGGLAAHADRHTLGVACIADQLDRTRHRRVPCGLVTGDGTERTVGGHGVLGQIVGADGHEVGDLGDLVGHQGDERDLGHRADLTDTLDHYAGTMPIVQIGGHQQSFRTSMVSIDENAAMELIMRHLTERGAHAVAYMASKEISFESAELFTMFHTQVRSYRLTTHTDWNQFGERTVQRGYDCSMRLFAKDNRPDALVCADDAVAFGAMVALHTLGLRVPEDVRIVGFDDSPLAATTMPTLTSVQPPFEQIVAESLRLISTGNSTPAHVSLLPQLVIRESTGYGER